ncbi:hypothetical protein HG15A2_00960 [Adhaeretor mobilis]|uniref:Uncharacterized protein n=1 Tax=Adhaeretor mobilis TaxID=1930276 RepID=A0A517MPM8_9BACT|nr:hypothetical protein HG15A2_00960 [Adhaeretor mobilis]
MRQLSGGDLGTIHKQGEPRSEPNNIAGSPKAHNGQRRGRKEEGGTKNSAKGGVSKGDFWGSLRIMPNQPPAILPSSATPAGHDSTHEKTAGVLREKSPAEQLSTANVMWIYARSLISRALRSEYPDWAQGQIDNNESPINYLHLGHVAALGPTRPAQPARGSPRTKIQSH